MRNNKETKGTDMETIKSDILSSIDQFEQGTPEQLRSFIGRDTIECAAAEWCDDMGFFGTWDEDEVAQAMREILG